VIWITLCLILLVILVLPLIVSVKIQVHPQYAKFALLFNGFRIQQFDYHWNASKNQRPKPQDSENLPTNEEKPEPAEGKDSPGKAEAILLQLMIIGAVITQVGMYIKGSRPLVFFAMRLSFKSLQKLKVRFYGESLTLGVQDPDVLGRIWGVCSILQAWGLLEEFNPVFFSEQIEADLVWKIRLDLWRLLYLFLYFLIYMPWLPLWQVIREHKHNKKQDLSEKVSLAL
jgi:hypothetical protein